MKKRLIILLLIWLPFLSNAQEIKQNNVYLELGGASVFYSVNYERLWFKNTEHNMATRLGLMYVYTFDERDRAIRGIPVSVSYLKKMKKNYFEVGVSFATMRDTYPILDQNKEQVGYIDELILMPSLRVGIRHQPTDSKFFWNVLAQGSVIAFGDIEDFDPEVHVFPFISIGVGYSF